MGLLGPDSVSHNQLLKLHHFQPNLKTNLRPQYPLQSIQHRHPKRIILGNQPIQVKFVFSIAYHHFLKDLIKSNSSILGVRIVGVLSLEVWVRPYFICNSNHNHPFSASSGVPYGPTTRRDWCFHQVQTAECVIYLGKTTIRRPFLTYIWHFSELSTRFEALYAKSRQSGLLPITSTLRSVTHSAVYAW